MYDIWIDNSINSNDGKYGRNIITIKKCSYLEQYSDLHTKDAIVEECTSKRGGKYYSANRMIVTCFLNTIQWLSL